MKYSSARMMLLTSCVISAFVGPMAAQANNTVVEDALKNRPDLSVFYQGLVNTGVLSELDQNKSYTIFAPTNDAFAKTLPAQYPCFYDAYCKAQAANILRNHIVPGEEHLGDIGSNHTGGIMSMFSINQYHLTASETTNNRFSVDGRKVLDENQLAGSMLYRIDGLLATDREMVQFTAPNVVLLNKSDLPPRVPDGMIVNVSVPVTGNLPDASPAR